MALGPLEGFVIGVTADRRWQDQAELLERRGGTVVHGPTIRTEYLGEDEALRTATEAIIERRPDHLVLTTGIGVRAWLEAVQAWGLGDQLLAALADTRVVARGPKATAGAQAAGLAVWDTPGEQLVDVVARLRSEPLAGRTVAFQHYGEHNPAAVAALEAEGAEVLELPIYRWRPPFDLEPACRLVDAVATRRVDAVTFTSAPAVASLVAVADDAGLGPEVLEAFNTRDVIGACIGPVCSAAARRAGIVEPVAPEVGRLGLLVRVLAGVLADRCQRVVLRGEPMVVQGRAVLVDDRPVDVPDRERVVLTALLARRGAVVSRATFLRALGGEETSGRALEATVARLRRRLGPAGEAIRTVRGRGYLLDAERRA